MNDETNLPTDLKSLKKPLILKRQLIVFFSFLSCFIMFLLRYNMSVAIVAIKEEKIKCLDYEIISINESNYGHSIESYQNDSVICYENKYKFDETMISQLLAAYFYGYSLFQLPVGRLSEKYGSKQLIGYAVLFSGILTAITPFTLDISPILTLITRFLIGTLHAGILASIYQLLSVWLPKEKNANAITWANIGYELGGMTSFLVTGYISSIDYLGWRSSFYLFSISSLIFYIPYHYLIYSSPSDDPYLSDYEKKLIEEEKKIEFMENDSIINTKLVKVPPKLNLKCILTSGQIWASIFAKFSYGFGYYVITTKIPDYLKEVFNLSISDNGFYSSLPLLGILLSKILCLKLVNYLISLNVMSLTNVRKLFQSISLFTPAICLLILTFKNDDKNLDIFLIFLAMFGSGFICGGDGPITSEFSGQLSGSIFGLTNTLSSGNGFLAPTFVGFILDSWSNKFLAWNFIFYNAIFLYCLGGIIFMIFASSELAEWAKPIFISLDEKNSKKSAV